MPLFCYIARSVSNWRHCVFSHYSQFGKRYCCKRRGRTGLPFELRAPDGAK